MIAMKKLIVATVIVSAMALFAGCYYDKAEQVYPQQAVCDTTAVKYSQDIVAILSANCYSCHSGTASAGGGFKLDSHGNLVVFVNNGKLLKAITHSAGASAMPKNMPKMPECNINKITAWINDGAPNN